MDLDVPLGRSKLFHLKKTRLISSKVVFLAEQLPKVIRKDQFWSEQLIQGAKI